MIQFSCSSACSKSGWTPHALSWMSVKPQRCWWSSPAVKESWWWPPPPWSTHDTTLNNQLKIQNPEEVLPKDVPSHKTELLSPRTSYWHPSTMFKHSPCVTTVHHHILQDRNCWHIMKVWSKIPLRHLSLENDLQCVPYTLVRPLFKCRHWGTCKYGKLQRQDGRFIRGAGLELRIISESC